MSVTTTPPGHRRTHRRRAALTAVLALGLTIAALAPLPKPAGAVINGPPDESMPWALKLSWEDGLFCSGFMLTEHWIVTAAHCIDDRAFLQRVTISTMEGGQEVAAYSGIARYEPHPTYLDRPGVENDIGLVGLFGSGVVPELRAPLYADAVPRGTKDFVYFAGFGFGSDPGGADSCTDPDTTTDTRRLSVMGLTGGAYPSTGTPLAVRANPQIGVSCGGDSGGPWTFRKEWKNFVFAVNSGGTEDVKVGTLLNPKFAWITQTTADSGRPIDCPTFFDTDAELRYRQCTEGHRMLVREGTGSPTSWRIGATDLSSVVVGDVDGNGDDDLLRSAANRIWVSWAGRSVWVPTPARWVTGATFAYGDFDGNGTTDILRSVNGTWHATFSSPNRTWSAFTVTRITNDPLGSAVRVGDFDGNGSDDLFQSRSGDWFVSWGSGGVHTEWQLVGSSSAPMTALKVGDFDGDGADEVFYANGSSWRVSYSPHTRGFWSKWVTVNSSQYTTLEIADFDENGSDDVFRSSSSEWRISYSTRKRTPWSSWQHLRYSRVPVSAAAFGDFDRNGGTDGLYFAACPQYC